MDAIGTSDGMSDAVMDKDTRRWKLIEEYLVTHEYIMNADVRKIFEVSAATSNRILAGYTAEEKLVKCHVGVHWGYREHD